MMRYPDETPRWRRYLRLAGPNVRRDVDEELRFHFDTRIEELVSGGLSAQDAREQAVREFGDVDDVRNDLVSIDRRVVAKRSRMETLRDTLTDTRYAIRSLSRTPGVALAILATLALGVGANATMFSLLDTIFLRPPAVVTAPNGLRRVWWQLVDRKGVTFWSGFSYPQYEAVVAALGDRAQTAIYRRPASVRVGVGERAEQTQVSNASASYFELLGIRARLGRVYSRDDDRLDQPEPVVVVSDAYWRSHMNADPNALGSQLVIAGIKRTIIGVMPADFTGVDLNAADLWLPLGAVGASRRATPWYRSNSVNGFQVLVRPQRLASEAELAQRLTAALRRPEVGYSASDSLTVAKFGSIMAANGPGEKSQEERIAVRLAGVSIIVLLIACANLINLLLARAIRRRREIAVRLALGISRGRLLRLLLTESAVLSAAAGIAAIAVAYAGGLLLRRLLLPDVHWSRSPIDPSVLAFALIVALAAGMFAGLVPALQAASPELTAALKAGAAAGAVHRSRLRSALVVAQAGLSVVLLVGAALFVRSLGNVRDLDIGYNAQRVVTAGVSFDDRSRYADPTFVSRLTDLAARVASVRGVEHSGLTSMSPMSGFSVIKYYTDTDSLRITGDWMPTTTGVSRGYFAAAGLQVLSGADFTDHNAIPVIAVNETFAKATWPGRNALGQCVRLGARDASCFTVSAVVSDSRMGKIIESAAPKLYVPADHLPADAAFLAPSEIIISVDPRRMTEVSADVRALIREAFPGGVPTFTRLADYLEPQYRPWQLGAELFSMFGVLALIVAVVGIYSTVSYGVNQRTHEFGVRIALGAKIGDVVRLVVGQGMRPVAGGIVLGIFLSIAAGRFIASLLYGVTATDPKTYVVVTLVLVATGAAAALVPAWRAARVDPVSALRSD
jgi:putative ABC transport system permease protein